jgi:hypothetical protein
MPRKPANHTPMARVDLKLPKAWLAMADQLAIITEQTRAAYLRDAVIRQMTTDWNTTPGRGFWLRPNVPVYRRDGGGFKQVAATLGGERCWPIENLGQAPASMPTGLLFRVDIVPVGTTGLTLTDAIVPRSGFGGPV